jgi:hypothetical protein
MGQMTTPASVDMYRLLGFGDCHQVLALIHKNAERFVKGGLSQLPLSESDYLKWLSSSDDCIVGAFKNGVCIGFSGATHMRVGNMETPGAGLWYGVDVDAQGIGVATVATLKALRHFNRKFSSVDTAVIHCSPKNKKSMAVAHRLGFERTPDADYRRYQSSRSFTSFEGHSANIGAILEKECTLSSRSERKTNMQSKNTCAVGGVLKSPTRAGQGAMCGSIIVGGKLCGFSGECPHQRPVVDKVSEIKTSQTSRSGQSS